MFEKTDKKIIEKKKKIGKFKKFIDFMFKKPIKKHLINHSEPLEAYKKQDMPVLKRFFNLIVPKAEESNKID